MRITFSRLGFLDAAGNLIGDTWPAVMPTVDWANLATPARATSWGLIKSLYR
jgi:hypothetical protein